MIPLSIALAVILGNSNSTTRLGFHELQSGIGRDSLGTIPSGRNKRGRVGGFYNWSLQEGLFAMKKGKPRTGMGSVILKEGIEYLK